MITLVQQRGGINYKRLIRPDTIDTSRSTHKDHLDVMSDDVAPPPSPSDGEERIVKWKYRVTCNRISKSRTFLKYPLNFLTQLHI